MLKVRDPLFTSELFVSTLLVPLILPETPTLQPPGRALGTTDNRITHKPAVRCAERQQQDGGQCVHAMRHSNPFPLVPATKQPGRFTELSWRPQRRLAFSAAKRSCLRNAATKLLLFFHVFARTNPRFSRALRGLGQRGTV